MRGKTLLSLTFLTFLTGCIAFARLKSGNSESVAADGIHHVQIGHHPHRVGPYWGPECVRIGAPTNIAYASSDEPDPTMGKQPNLSHDPADQILRLVCVETIMADEDEPHRNTWVTQHFRFDELFFDHFTASMMLVQCLEADSCLDAPHVRRIEKTINNPIAQRMMAEQAARPPDVWQYYEVAMMRWYADHVDPAEVAKKLAGLPLPPAAQQTYMRLLDVARQHVVAMSDTLTLDGKRLFLDIPLEVYARRTAEHAKSQKILAELGVLIDRAKAERAAGTQGVSDETVARLAKLRVAYEATCKKDCTRGAIFATITKQLFWAHVSRGDAPAAMAESKLLDKLEPTTAQEIAEKQSKAIEDARGRLARVKSARDQGIDADSARATANGSVLDLGDGRYVYVWSSDFAIHWESLIPDGRGAIAFEGKIAGLDRRGAQVTVRFHDIVSSWEEGTNCYETGRIESISSDGRINYREQCAGSTTKSSRHKVPPVTMPASEAAGLAAGDEVFGFANTERAAARVWGSHRGKRLVRLRDVAL